MTGEDDADRGGRPDRRVLGRCALLLSLLLAGLLTGCASPIDGARGFPPFFERGPASSTDLDGQGPEFARSSDPGRVTRIWPLYSHTESPNRTTTRVLHPIFKHEVTPEETQTWLLPLYLRTLREHGGPGRVDRHTLLLPFLWGRDHELGSYFGVFPIGGSITGLLGLDRIEFVLFPLYTRTRDRDRVAHHVLFPLIHWTSGTRLQGWRVFPFHSHYEGYTSDGEPRFRSSSWLWPLIHRHEADLNTDQPTLTRWVFPLYGTIESERLRRWSVLWPLFSKDVYPGRGWTSVAVFPLLRLSWQGEELAQFDLFPLYGHKHTEDFRRTFILWPLLGAEEQLYHANATRRSRWFFPFYRHTEKEALREGRDGTTRTEITESKTRIWPLYRHVLHKDGRREWSLLDPLPFPDPPGFDAFYSRLWRIYRAVEDPAEQRQAWEALWGLAHGQSTPDERSWSILGGLIARTVRSGEGDAEDETTWRLLFLPF